jgi:hypothetical protein
VPLPDVADAGPKQGAGPKLSARPDLDVRKERSPYDDGDHPLFRRLFPALLIFAYTGIIGGWLVGFLGLHWQAALRALLR